MKRWVAASAACVLASCANLAPPPIASTPEAPTAATIPTAPMTPELSILSAIRAPTTVEAKLKLRAQGVQIFHCEQRDKSWQWIFKQPDAQLSDGSGKALVHHGANYSFEDIDTSRLLGSISAHDAASSSKDLPWLLLTTRSFGDGQLAGVTHVQRINTLGGMPPAACSAAQKGELLRVDFSADFVFYKPR